ncbi:MAG: selenide, water dikinase SelD [Firmicutes bacterium]|nr:selenide, water dikinase SelD [Bacillota bacterium]
MQVLHNIPPNNDPRVLVGRDYTDDAGVFELDRNTRIVQTVDFFTPIVDDPESYGRIAAANSLSDIYAMGGKPLTALNIVCFPLKTLGPEVLSDILLGAWKKLKEAGVSLLGGHTVEDPEPKFGLAVTGILENGKFLTLGGCKPGDQLILTKPLGMGIITTALKNGKASESLVKKAVNIMETLNDKASRLMKEYGANACTDITGYGLLGHAWEMSVASKMTLQFYSKEIPILQEAYKLLKLGFYPGGSKSNLNFLHEKVYWASSVTNETLQIMCDAQTSGGLLISVSQNKAQELVRKLKQEGISDSAIVGDVKKSGVHPLVVI